MTRVLVAALLGVAGAGLGAWLAVHSTHARSRVATGTGPAVPVDVAPLVESSPAKPPRIAAPVPPRSSAPPAPIQAGRVDSPEVAAATPEPGPTAAPDPPAVVAEPGRPPSPPAPAAAATALPKVSDRVTGWLKGEVQEFRGGVRREVDDFRSGWDKLRRGVRQLGSKIRVE